MAAGPVSYTHLDVYKRQVLDEPYIFTKDYNGTIALDGERTVSFRAGDEIKVVVTRNGPLRAELSKVMDEAVKKGFFRLP